MQFTRSCAAAAVALLVSAGASATTTSVVGLASNPTNAYFFTVTGPSTVVGDTDPLGLVNWSGVLLQSPTVPYTAFDGNPDDGFSFTGLTAGTYGLTFLSAGGDGVYGGYYTVTSVPEPETYAMFLAGLGALGLMASRRRRNQG